MVTRAASEIERASRKLLLCKPFAQGQEHAAGSFHE